MRALEFLGIYRWTLFVPWANLLNIQDQTDGSHGNTQECAGHSVYAFFNALNKFQNSSVYHAN